MQSLTQVRSVDVGSRNGFAFWVTAPWTRIPSKLFQSAKSVTLSGRMEYGLVKSILDGVIPAMLKHVHLDMVQDHAIDMFRQDSYPEIKVKTDAS